MAKKTKRDLTILGLLAIGYTLDTQARTSKYQVYQRGDEPKRYFVGKSGGLRVSRNGKAGSSLSLTGGKIHKALQEVGSHAESYTSVEQAQKVYAELLEAAKKPNKPELIGGADLGKGSDQPAVTIVEVKQPCLKIQWAKLCTIDGKPVCPSCHEPAEMIVGFTGNPCWAHVPKN